jgi:glycosyltransferase involved in cell wall biosynthesis
MMDSFWSAVGLFVAGLAIIQTLLMVVQTWEYRRFARNRLANVWRCRARGRAVIFVPCRGVDVELEENLDGLFRQDYRDYEVWFILEGSNDPAYPTVRRVMAAHPGTATRLILAGPAEESGQKVHNLRVATETLPPEITYLAFLDADARPSPCWLRVLLARLDRGEVGATTGYRWFVPLRPSLANHLLYAMNAGIAMFCSRNGPNVIWGGSWAMRRDLFQRLEIREVWKGTLSDDFVATRALYRAGLHVEFQPACVVASPADFSLRAMCSFVRRQYVIGRSYFLPAWLLGVTALSLANLVFWGGLAAAGWGLAGGPIDPRAPGAVVAFAWAACFYRGLLRRDLARLYLPDRQESLRRACRFDLWSGPLVGLFTWAMVAGSWFGSRIAWRGIVYRLLPGGKIQTISRGEPAVRPVFHGDVVGVR